jgi:putative flippase GtrA
MDELRRSETRRHFGILMRDSSWRSQFFRFLVVGVLNTLFGQAIFIGLVLLDVANQVALLVATVIGILFNFRTVGSLVFQDHNRQKNLLVGFLLCCLFSYAINSIALNVLTGCGLSAILSQAILIVPIAVLTFLLNRRYVFFKDNSNVDRRMTARDLPAISERKSQVGE